MVLRSRELQKVSSCVPSHFVKTPGTKLNSAPFFRIQDMALQVLIMFGILVPLGFLVNTDLCMTFSLCLCKL